MKHGAARTVVEQVADAGPMFKGMKLSVKTSNQPNSSTSPIFLHLEITLSELAEAINDPTDTKVVVSAHHKRITLMITLSKLPGATGKAFSTTNVQKGFVLNGQLDSDSKLAPDMFNLLHTYCGNVTGTCLANPLWLIQSFFEQMYNTGIISEALFDVLSIPKDRDLNGVAVEKSFGVSQENRQRAKILSSKTQIYKRKKLVYNKKLEQYRKELALFKNEVKEYALNAKCKSKLLGIMVDIKTGEGSLSEDDIHSMTFESVRGDIMMDILNTRKKSILCNEGKAFVKVQSKRQFVTGRLAYEDVPERKDDVLQKMVVVINSAVKDKYFSMAEYQRKDQVINY